LLQDLRQYPRLVPGSLLLVHVDEYTGRVSNLCEGGFAVDGIFPKIQGEVFCLALDLPDSSSPMRATAQTAWTSDSENRTGVHFVHLPASSRQQLSEWISAQVAATVMERSPQAFRAPARDAQFNFAAIRRELTSGVNPTELEAERRHGRSRRLTGLCLTTMTFCSALFFLGYYLGSRSDFRGTRMLAPAATTPDLPAAAQVESAEPSPAKNPLLSTVSLDAPGFVLQVGAMTHEANAEGLSETLQENDFPAFVFKRENNRFYKVAVGSFADAESAAEVKRKLEKQGFKAILLRWSPE
jgi:sporulation related protein/PilZ domain-containing protein